MKKTLIATLIMAVALMMTLSGAVFAATALTLAAPAEATEGADVAVTITYPADIAGYQYKVTYNPEVLEYVSGADSATAGTLSLADIDSDYNAKTSTTLNFKAKAVGTSDVKVDGDIKLVGTDASKITDATANTVTVAVAKKAEEVAPVEENKASTDTTETNSAEDTTATTDKDATKKSLKDTKTGFDAMYIVYLAAAVVVAGGVVAVARRK